MRLPMAPGIIGLVLATLLTIHVLPQLASVLLLVFAGLIMAVLLDTLTSALRRVLPLAHTPAYGVALGCVIVVLLILGFLIGPQLAKEIPELVERIPNAWHAMLAHLNNYAVFDSILDKARQPLAWLTHKTQILNLVSSTFGILLNVFVVLFVGVYGAAAPQHYLHFADRLLTESQRENVGVLAHDLGRGLRHWMFARAASMTVVGVATGIGLWLLGVPLAFTLGFIAGVFSFVPYIGPILGLIPALLIAVVQSLALAGWVLLVYAIVQLLETTLLTPLIQQRAIAMPPVVLISVQLIGGVLIGPLGVLLAAPLVLCALIVARWHRSDAVTG